MSEEFTVTEFITGEQRFNNYKYEHDLPITYFDFLLGAIDQEPLNITFTFNDSTSKRLRMILSPHYRTILEAYRHAGEL